MGFTCLNLKDTLDLCIIPKKYKSGSKANTDGYPLRSSSTNGTCSTFTEEFLVLASQHRLFWDSNEDLVFKKQAYDAETYGACPWRAERNGVLITRSGCINQLMKDASWPAKKRTAPTG